MRGNLVPQADGRWNGLMATCCDPGGRESDKHFFILNCWNFPFKPFRQSLATLGLGRRGSVRGEIFVQKKFRASRVFENARFGSSNSNLARIASPVELKYVPPFLDHAREP